LTKKEYRKDFDRKKKIDLRNEKRPEYNKYGNKDR